MSYFKNSETYAIINGTSDDDTIYNSGITHWSQLNGGAGNDSICNAQGNNVTIRGGTGDDTIRIKSLYAGSNVIQYYEGDGNDYFIDEYNPSSPNWTLKIGDGDGNYSTEKSGSDLIVNVGSGKITLASMGSKSVNIAGTYSTGNGGVTLENGNDNSLVAGTSNADSIFNYGNFVTVDTGAGDDTVVNASGGYNSFIYCGNGNDTVLNASIYDTIYGGSGSDTIKSGSYSRVYGDAGNDFIYVVSGDTGKNTLNGGVGNDTVSLGGGKGSNGYYSSDYGGDHNLIIYNDGDGYDIIYNYTDTDTISIGGSAAYMRSKVGSDVVISLESGAMTLVGANGKTINIAGGSPVITIVGTNNADIISNTLAGATIQALGGADTVANSGANVSIDTGAGNDSIFNVSEADNVTISGSAGNDDISNGGSYSSISGGADNDTIYNQGHYATIDGGAGRDSIYNSGSNVSIDGSAGDDSISNGNAYNVGGSAVTIAGGAGNDSIYNHYGSNVLFKYTSGDGNDYIEGFNETSTLKIGGGYDTYSTTKSGSDLIVSVGDGSVILKDINLASINVNGETLDLRQVTLTEGDDTYSNNVSGATILALGGADKIDNIADSVSIDGGAGDDLISLEANAKNNFIIYNSGYGNDSVIGFKANSTLQIGDGLGTYSTTKSGNDVIVSVGYGKITLRGAASLSTLNIAGTFVNLLDIVGTNGADKITNTLDGATIQALAGNDSIENWRSTVSIDGGDGDDIIDNHSFNVTIDAGDGNDSIRNYNGTAYVTINAGAGKDTIVNEENFNVTINGGAGDDRISLSTDSKYNVIQYAEGDGNDAVYGFNADDTLQIGDGTGTYSTQVSGNDVIVTVGDGKITLVGAATLSTVNILGEEVATVDPLNIVGTEGADNISNSLNSATINALGGNDTITNSGDFVDIDGGNGNDLITHTGLGGMVWGGLGNDTFYVTAGMSVIFNYNEGDGNDIIHGFEGSALLIGDGDGTYSTQVSGNDIVVKVGESSITLKDTAQTDWLNIHGTYVNPLSIVGTNAADNISNTLDGATIQALGGADTVANSGANVSIAGSSGNDSIVNYSTGSKTKIYGGSNNDIIINSAASVTVDGGDYADKITNKGVRSSIYGGAGDDQISNNATQATILGGTDNDSIVNYNTGSNAKIDAGAGNDTVKSSGASVTIDGGDGDDYIENYGSSVSIDGNAGNDYIWSSGSNITVDGNAEDDTISNYNGANVSISGGAGSDRIYNTGSGATVNGGSGDDLISLSSDANNNLITYKSGDGNDTIYGFNATSTLQIGDGTTDTYSSTLSGSDIIVTVGTGKITLVGAKNLSTVNIAGKEILPVNPLNIVGNNNANKISNTLSGATIQALGGADTVANSGANVSIVGGTGNDSLVNYSTASKSKIYGGDGSDTVINSAATVTIDGGDYDDKITNKGANSSVIGGKGNDTISNSGANVTFQYASGDGNDLITGFNATSTLKIGNGTTDTYSKATSGNDVVVTVGTGKITLSGAKTLTTLNILGTEKNPLNIVGTNDANKISNTLAGATIQAQGGADTVANSGANVSIVGGTGNDSIVNYNTGTKSKIYGGANKDTIINSAATVTIDGGDYDDKITNKGANSSVYGGANNDTLINSAATVTLNGGAGNDLISLGSAATNNLITYTAGNDSIIGYTEDDTISIASGTAVTSTVGNDLILTVGTGSINLRGAKDKVVTYVDANGKHTYPASDDKGVVIDGKTARLTEYYTANSYSIAENFDVTTIDASVITYKIELTGNKMANSILGGKGRDIIRGAGGDDTFTGGAGSDVFVYNEDDGSDVITDYSEADGDLISIASSEIATALSRDGNDIVFTVGKGLSKGYITLTGGRAQEIITYYDGNGDEYFITNEIVTFKDRGATLLGIYSKEAFNIADYPANANAITINASAVQRDLNITANDSANRIIGSGQNDFIDGKAGADTISGSDGNDTIVGGKGNDSMNGGNGSDVFVYNNGDGDDIIRGYAEEDRISIASGSVSSVGTNDKDVILIVGTGHITITGGTERLITYIDADGKGHVYPDAVDFSADSKQATILSSYQKSEFKISDYGSYGTTVQTIRTANTMHDLSITGNSNANAIYGNSSKNTLSGQDGDDTLYGSGGNDYLSGGAGKDILNGGADNDTLIGGTDNDTLYGGDGTDYFLFRNGDGYDVIADYAKGEIISVAGAAVSAKTVSGNDVVFTVGAGKITVKNAAKNKTTVTYYDNTKTTAQTYTPSANDLLIDDNYSTDAAQLSQLVEPAQSLFTPYDFDAGFSLTRNEKNPVVLLAAKY